MSEGVIIALVGMGGTIGGAVVSQLFNAAKNRLEAYRMGARDASRQPTSVAMEPRAG